MQIFFFHDVNTSKILEWCGLQQIWLCFITTINHVQGCKLMLIVVVHSELMMNANANVDVPIMAESISQQ